MQKLFLLAVLLIQYHIYIYIYIYRHHHVIYIYIYISSSSCRAANMDLPEPLSPFRIYHLSHPGGIPVYILYRHRAVVYRF